MSEVADRLGPPADWRVLRAGGLLPPPKQNLHFPVRPPSPGGAAACSPERETSGADCLKEGLHFLRSVT